MGSFRHSKEHEAVRPAQRLSGAVAECPQSADLSPLAFSRGLGGSFIGLEFCRRRFWARLFPKSLGDVQGIDL